MRSNPDAAKSQRLAHADFMGHIFRQTQCCQVLASYIPICEGGQDVCLAISVRPE
ncbi:hypothetical protein [Desulfovulcanus sp.]